MSLTETTNWIVCYDIADRRRLARVHRLMRKWGIPLQHSVFLVEASAVRLQRLLAKADALIDSGSDDLRAYRFAAGSECHTIGPALLSDEILIGNAGLTLSPAGRGEGFEEKLAA